MANSTKISGQTIITVLLALTTITIMTKEFFFGNGGFLEVRPGEAAVLYNNTGLKVLGESEEIIGQGAKTFLPGLQHIEVLERRPQLFVMADETGRDKEHGKDRGKDYQVTKKLTVRANDGSNFYFDRLEIYYQIIPSAAGTVIRTLGPRNSFKKHAIATHAREILRDEFGRYDFLEVANPATFTAATSEAKRRLNERLLAYGIEITQIVTPKPKFDSRVEKATEDRQNAEQEIEVQDEKRRKLEQEKGLKIQSIEQTKNAEYQSLLAELESKKKEADNNLKAVKREADKYYTERLAAGEAYKVAKETKAKANEVAYRKEAEGLVAKITSVGASGPDVLNKVIAEKVFPQLKNVKATPLIKMSTPLEIRQTTSSK